jgi:hypothetical protein
MKAVIIGGGIAGRILLEEFPAGRNIVLLDNLEDAIDPATFKLSDTSLDAALGELLTAPQHGVKVIGTTRLAPRELLLRPGRSKRLDLDEGLPPGEAIKVLKGMDLDGALGLRDAATDQLAAACERTRGFPRALEALAAILAADRDATLFGLLTTAQDVLPEEIVEVLVGEAFQHLDPLGRQVMQALAIYGAPVPPVAVDFLLQPVHPAIDSGPVLSRLVNMHFARRDAGRYYLHQVDRDYALGRIQEQQDDARAAQDQSPGWRGAPSRSDASEASALDGDLARLKTGAPGGWSSCAGAVRGRDGAQPVTGAVRGIARAAARRAPQVLRRSCQPGGVTVPRAFGARPAERACPSSPPTRARFLVHGQRAVARGALCAPLKT